MAPSKNGDASHHFQSMSSSTCSEDDSGRVTNTSAPTSPPSTSDGPDGSANIEVQQSPPQQQRSMYRSADETPITKPSTLHNPLPKECDSLHAKKSDKLAYSRSGESIDLDIPSDADTTTFYLDRHHGQHSEKARNVTTKVAKAMHQMVPEEAEIQREADGTNIEQVQQFGQQQAKCEGLYTPQATTTTTWYGHECKGAEQDLLSGKGTIRTSSGGFATERMPNVLSKSPLLSDTTAEPITPNRLPAQEPGSRGLLPPKRRAPSPPPSRECQTAKADLNYATTGNDKGNFGGQFDSFEEDWVIVNDETEVGVMHQET